MPITVLLATFYVLQVAPLLTHAKINTSCPTPEEWEDSKTDPESAASNSDITLPAEEVSGFPEYKIYPNLRCHRGFYQRSSMARKDMSSAEDILTDLNAKCTAMVEENSQICFKQCMMQKLGVLGEDNTLNHIVLIGNMLEMIISAHKHNYSGPVIAAYINRDCPQIYEKVSNKPCSEWGPFYECVENAWKCHEYSMKYVGKPIRRIIKLPYGPGDCWIQVLKRKS